MTLREALNTGYRVTNKDWFLNSFWIKKTHKEQYIQENGYIGYLNTIDPFIFEEEWFIHPEDQKLIDFKNKLEEILK